MKQNLEIEELRTKYLELIYTINDIQRIIELRQFLIDAMDYFEQSDIEIPLIAALEAFEKAIPEKWQKGLT